MYQLQQITEQLVFTPAVWAVLLGVSFAYYFYEEVFQ